MPCYSFSHAEATFEQAEEWPDKEAWKVPLSMLFRKEKNNRYARHISFQIDASTFWRRLQLIHAFCSARWFFTSKSITVDTCYWPHKTTLTKADSSKTQDEWPKAKFSPRRQVRKEILDWLGIERFRDFRTLQARISWYRGRLSADWSKKY